MTIMSSNKIPMEGVILTDRHCRTTKIASYEIVVF
jgi:hypothetical protein